MLWRAFLKNRKLVFSVLYLPADKQINLLLYKHIVYYFATMTLAAVVTSIFGFTQNCTHQPHKKNVTILVAITYIMKEEYNKQNTRNNNK